MRESMGDLLDIGKFLSQFCLGVVIKSKKKDFNIVYS